MITNFPGMQIKPGSMGKPFPGITATVLDPKTLRAATTEPGRVGPDRAPPGLAVDDAQPTGTTRGLREASSGTAGTSAGTGPASTPDGYFWFVGRDDDVINTGGHLVGPFEIESALLEHPAVAESAAVAKPDPVNMEVVKAFVALKPGFAAERRPRARDHELRSASKLSPLAMPQEIEFVASLPKTRSGKILRRVLRAQEWGEPVGRHLDPDGRVNRRRRWTTLKQRRFSTT